MQSEKLFEIKIEDIYGKWHELELQVPLDCRYLILAHLKTQSKSYQLFEYTR